MMKSIDLRITDQMINYIKEKLSNSELFEKPTIRFSENKNINLEINLDDSNIELSILYDIGKIPAGIPKLLDTFTLFPQMIEKIEIKYLSYVSNNTTLFISNLTLNKLYESALAETISELANEAICISENRTYFKHKLITGIFLLSDYEDKIYFKHPSSDLIYDCYGSEIYCDEWTIPNSHEANLLKSFDEPLFGGKSYDERGYDGFVLLHEDKGFHLEAKALYKKNDFEPFENMW